jgi:arabinan endo-1,5-alpha-L-arabinosidase
MNHKGTKTQSFTKLLSVSLCLCVFVVQLYAQPDSSRISVHDPVLIKQDSVYYLFCTGRGISVWSSKNLTNWKREKPVFDTLPWAVQTIKGFRNHIWAPDISYYNGLYYLYYSVSAFGKNTSCIGVATSKSLHPGSADFKWTDHGKVVQSVPGRDMWNAIDPNLAVDDKGDPWLVFGSFWNGMKLVKLNKDRKSVAQPEQWYTVASRPRNYILPDSVAGDAAIEAPFIYKKDNYYYLFVSFDYCCRGEKSTYKIMVGRAGKIEGPYVDRDGVPMNTGGGSLVLEGDKNWGGVGHNAVVNINGEDYVVFHAYDLSDKGRSKLRLEKLLWRNGWPVIQPAQL